MPDFESIAKLDRDLNQAARAMNQSTVRYFVDLYYQIQEFRKGGANQHRAAATDGEPHRLVEWLFGNMRRLEANCQRALEEFTDEYSVGQWMKSITGIGPVISAGMLAHLDIRKAPTVGHFWRFAGYDPTVKWEKKQKRPWNADLKCLCYKLSDCFVKFSNHKDQFYGTIYNDRKAYELAKNEAGDYAAQAENALAVKRFGDQTEAKKHYLQGRLPPGHLNSRAMRYTAKLFLSHLHHVMYADYFGSEPPAPFSFEHCEGDHRHFIAPPNFPFAGTGKSLAEFYG